MDSLYRHTEIGTENSWALNTLMREASTNTDGIKFFGKTYTINADEDTPEKREACYREFIELFDNAVKIMLFERYYLRAETLVNGADLITVTLPAAVEHLARFAEGCLAPYAANITQVSAYDGASFRFDRSAVTLRMLAAPIALPLALLANTGDRFMCMVYFNLAFQEQEARIYG